MRAVVGTLAAMALITGTTVPMVVAAPVPSYEALYEQMISACSLGTGSVPACDIAINEYTQALIGGNVDIEDANGSLLAAQATVFAVNEPDEQFQADIDALFDLLLPDAGAIEDDILLTPGQLGETSSSPG